ncbi:hypothetical protein DV737_g1126, partial [Chaetothyriales sp. CBS 132003]
MVDRQPRSNGREAAAKQRSRGSREATVDRQSGTSASVLTPSPVNGSADAREKSAKSERQERQGGGRWLRRPFPARATVNEAGATSRPRATNSSIKRESPIRAQHHHRRLAHRCSSASLCLLPSPGQVRCRDNGEYRRSFPSPWPRRPAGLTGNGSLLQLDKLVGMALLVVATTVFLYYTIWTLLIPFVDDNHPLQGLFPPRVWAIRVPVILILLASTVVGSFLAMVMIRSQQKKAAKAAAAKASQKNK